MSPKARFVVLLESAQLAALRAIEDRAGTRLSEQIRRAIDEYLDTQTVLSRAELARLRRG
jgi:hypothetical protein